MQNDQQEEIAPPSSTEDNSETESFSQLEQKYTAEQQKTEEYLDMLRRTQADFINYRRRATQEMTEARTAAQAQVLEQLLPILDDLGRALSASSPELAHHPWVQGIRLVTKRLMSTLERMGVRLIGRPGEQFDPRWHEALTMEARSDMPEGTVITVTRPGYTMGDRVIRPAQVIVSSNVSPMDTR
ncbi:MAG: nucleotide exchange factor GrpE [Ktedonobacteraceae bacterium]